MCHEDSMEGPSLLVMSFSSPVSPFYQLMGAPRVGGMDFALEGKILPSRSESVAPARGWC